MENRQPTLWSKRLVLAIFASLFMGISGQFLIPTLPLYVIELGIASQFAGIMTTAFALGSLLFRPFAGQMVDVIGRRKMFLIGSGICVLACGCYTIAPNFLILLFCRVLHGLGMCLAGTAIGTIVADVIPRERLTEGIGYYGLAGAISQTAGPAIGLVLLPLLGIRPIFFITAGVTFLSFLSGSQIKYQENLRPRAVGEKRKLKIIEPEALLPACMILMVSTAQSSLTTFLILFGKELSVTGLENFFLITSVGIICSRLFTGRLINRFGERKILVSACLISFACFILVSFARSLPAFLFASLVYGFGYGILYPLCNGMSLRHVTAENRGAATATFVGAYDLGTLLGTFFWGFVAAAIGYAGIYLVSSLMMLFILFIYFKLFLKKHPED